jgi:hypothetical protein
VTFLESTTERRKNSSDLRDRKKLRPPKRAATTVNNFERKTGKRARGKSLSLAQL